MMHLEMPIAAREMPIAAREMPIAAREMPIAAREMPMQASGLDDAASETPTTLVKGGVTRVNHAPCGTKRASRQEQPARPAAK